MGFAEDIKALAERILNLTETEEGRLRNNEAATKQALVIPFIRALGYNIENPGEVFPEYEAGMGTRGIKRHEKVDYAILKDDHPIMLFECKAYDAPLNIKVHETQLYRYFAALTKTRFGVITNGAVYNFFTDLDEPNVMDKTPFLEFNLRRIQNDDTLIEQIRLFTKTEFDAERIRITAERLKYKSEIIEILSSQAKQPSDHFVKFIAEYVYKKEGKGHITQAVRDQFAPIIVEAFQDFISRQTLERFGRLVPLLAKDAPVPQTLSPEKTEPVVEQPAEPPAEVSKIVTTEDELLAWHIIRAILGATIDAKRVVYRDAQSYCAILLDDNNRRSICRLYFSANKKFLGLFNDQRQEERVAIETVYDISKYADKLRAVVAFYDKPAKQGASEAT